MRACKALGLAFRTVLPPCHSARAFFPGGANHPKVALDCGAHVGGAPLSLPEFRREHVGRIVAGGGGSAASWGCKGPPARKDRVWGKCGCLWHFSRPWAGGLGETPTREGVGKERNSSRCAPCPELRLPELRLRKGRTLSVPTPLPSQIYFGTAQPWVPGAHLQVGGGLGMLLLVLLKFLRQTTLPHPTPFFPSSLRFLSFINELFPTLGPNLSVPTSLSAAPAPRPSSLFGGVIYIRKSLRRGREPSSQHLRVWGGGGAWLGPWCYHSGENCF